MGSLHLARKNLESAAAQSVKVPSKMGSVAMLTVLCLRRVRLCQIL